MDLRSIGSLRVSLVGLGCNNFGMRIDEAATHRVVEAALDAGINFFDTADIYGATKSEEFLGRALKGKRDRAIIATKFGMAVDDQRKGARPEYARRACDDSLMRLGIDCIDLYQLHQPDPGVPIADTLGAMNDLVQAGKVKEIGCSNFSADQLDEAAQATKPGAATFVSVQNEYSLLHREPEKSVLPACKRKGLAFLPYFPLASGLLTGKYDPKAGAPKDSRLSLSWTSRFTSEKNVRIAEALKAFAASRGHSLLELASGLLTGKYDPKAGAPKDSRLSLSWTSRFTSEKNVRIAEALKAFAASRGHSLLELAFSWLASHPPVASVIAGATSPEQIRANASAANWSLTKEDLSEIDRLART